MIEESVVRWRGKHIEEMSKEELLDVLYTICEDWFDKPKDSSEMPLSKGD